MELTGIKFPFSLNGRGGISMTTQTPQDSSILDGKIEQLLNTAKGERTMECNIFSELDTFIFEPTDTSTRTLLEHEIKNIIAIFIPEIEVNSVYIQVFDKAIFALISYTVKIYNKQENTAVRLGDIV